MRLSLIGTPERYENGVLEVFELQSNGKSDEEIVENLSHKYPEREINALLNRIKRFKEIKPLPKFEITLKILLWFFLFVKIINTIVLLTNSNFSPLSNTILFFIVPILNILALYLIYNRNPWGYNLVFLMGVIGLSNTLDSIEQAIELQMLPEIIIAIINVISISLLIFVSYKLKKNIPPDLLQLNKILDKNNIIINNRV